MIRSAAAMADLTQKCATTVSILALASLPGDRGAFEPTPLHDDFKVARGYVRRVVNGEVCHGVDWDGFRGVDSVFRENGRRSRLVWDEFRSWTQAKSRCEISEAGTKACELLLKHYGPYHEDTAEALKLRRKIERERDALIDQLDSQYPPAVRIAAREYLGPTISLSVKLPSVPPAPSLTEPGAKSDFALFQSSPPIPDFAVGGPFSKAESVLREFMNGGEPASPFQSVELFAREILERVQPLESELQIVDLKEALFRLPAIPGESQPADMDRIHYGALICRHRSIVVGLLLADAGFDVEIVRGTVEFEGHTGYHLFVYAPERGILEPSADGPEFWKEAIAAAEDKGKLTIKVKSGAVYGFEHRVPLRPDRSCF